MSYLKAGLTGVAVTIGIGASLTYFVFSTIVHKDPNPFNWEHHRYLAQRANDLADSDKNNLMSLVEIDDMYSRAGIKIQLNPFLGNTEHMFQGLTSAQLETVIKSYEAERK